SWVAAGGYDARWTASQQHFVYIFETSTGRLVGQFGPHGNVINHLAVSRDGRFLAATLGSGQGLRVWEKMGAGLATWRLAFEDKDYGGVTSFGAAFDRAGTLYAVGDDGKLRRYASSFTAKSVVEVRGGKQPYSVAVHPSGDRLAVGFADTTAVEVYDADPLAWRFAADTKAVTNGDLLGVAWSADGTQLFAGGRYYKDGQRPLLAWDRDGQGSARVVGGALNTIINLLPCGDDIAAVASDPAFGLVARDGSRRL